MTPQEIKQKINYYADYFDAMFWADIDDNNDLKRNDYSFTDIDTDCLIKQLNDLDKFFELADEILEQTDYSHEQACHDFYFTRCGHGVGFWENDHCNEEQGRQLTEIAQKFGEIYINDDGEKIYID